MLVKQPFRRVDAAVADLELPPSRAVDEALHGFILCTAQYSAFCEQAYGRYLHHHPEGGTPDGVTIRSGSTGEQLRRTVIAWTIVAKPGEQCVLWNLDESVGAEHPWGLDPARAAAIEAEARRLTAAR